MKPKIPFLLSIVALICPIIVTIVTCNIEEEFAEAIAGGLLFGCVLGSVFSVLALILNKNRNKIVAVLSVIPICPLVLYLVLAIPYFFFR